MHIVRVMTVFSVQILFLLGIGALSCLLTVLGYGYHNLDNTHSVDYLKHLYFFRENHPNVLDVSFTVMSL